MSFQKKIVLHCPHGNAPSLDALVERFIADGVKFVGVVGSDCGLVEDLIDEIVVGDGSQEYDLLTSSHRDESLEDAVEFAESLSGPYEGFKVQVVELK